MKPAPPQAGLGCADLLRALVAAGDDAALAQRYADLLGYAYAPPEPVSRLPARAPDPGASSSPTTSATPDALTPRYAIRLFGLLEAPQVDTPEPPPELPVASSGLSPDDCGPRVPLAPVRLLPLVAPGRLWPALKRLIQAPARAGLDVAVLVDRISRAQTLEPLPRRRVRRRADAIHVVWDRARHLAPLAPDLRLVAAELSHLAGHSGFHLYTVEGDPRRVTACRGMGTTTGDDALPVPHQARVIVVSDLGSARARPGIAYQRAWLDWLRALQRAGSTPCVISPVSSASLDLRMVYSLAGGALQPTGGYAARLGPVLDGALDAALERLKTTLACAVQVEPELLRAMRLADPRLAPYPELESLWYQAVDLPYTQDPALCPEVAAVLRQRLGTWPVDQQRRVLHLLRDQHAGDFRSFEMLEILLWAAHASAPARLAEHAAIDTAENWFAGFDCTREETADSAAVRAFSRSVWGVVANDIRVQTRYSRWLAPLWAADPGRRVQAPPPGLDPADLRTAIGRVPEALDCWLVQVGDSLRARGANDEAGLSPIAGPFATRRIEVRQQGRVRELAFRGEPLELARLTAGELDIRLDRARLRIGELEAPWWALEAGRDGAGAYVLMPTFAGPPLRLSLPLAVPGEATPRASGTPLRSGLDATGPYVDLHLGGVIQRLRWIPPGEFLMGSLEDEAERFSDESPQHRVVLTQGFWLADTVCTQGMWEVVMGDNPSHLHDDPELPVESISWDDAQKFLEKLGELVGAEAALPGEAQWEYACRAGTGTPFWWGDALSTEDANYNGSHPYAGGAKGEYRERTVAVKSFRPNPWGLWQMHGNVWEWCRDGPRNYGPEAVVDPVGPDEGGYRALRGGSWIDRGRCLRAAYRSADAPDFRSPLIGFRFLLRSLAEGPEGRG